MAATRNFRDSSLPARVGAFLAARSVTCGTVAVGLSGGCDSVVLLHVLSRLGLGERLCAIHVRHNLSANAGEWAGFCADYCRRLAVDLQLRDIEVERGSGLGLEAAARAARYRAFAGCAPDILLLGHHADDQAETLLFNLLRGAGVAGAAAIPAERRHGRLRILRPLLDCPRRDIEAYAREHGLAWVDDESNADTGLSRNFLRHDVLPVLAARFPAAGRNLAQASAHFAEADALLGELASADWQVAACGDAVSLMALRNLSPPRLRNLLRYRLRTLGWQVPAAARLDEFCRQLRCAAPDRHPALDLREGSMRAGKGLLRWVARG